MSAVSCGGSEPRDASEAAAQGEAAAAHSGERAPSLPSRERKPGVHFHSQTSVHSQGSQHSVAVGIPPAISSGGGSRVLYERLECVVLNGCETEGIGRSMLEVAARATRDGTPRISVVCWRTLAEDSAARAFGHGFYACVSRLLEARRRKLQQSEFSERSRFLPAAHNGFVPFVGGLVMPRCCERRLRLPREEKAHALASAAFDAGCLSFWQENFSFGNPEDYLHESSHEHMRNPDFSGECDGCTPPVHGQVVLLTCEEGVIESRLGKAPWGDNLSDNEPSRSMRMKRVASFVRKASRFSSFISPYNLDGSFGESSSRSTRRSARPSSRRSPPGVSSRMPSRKTTLSTKSTVSCADPGGQRSSSNTGGQRSSIDTTVEASTVPPMTAGRFRLKRTWGLGPAVAEELSAPERLPGAKLGEAAVSETAAAGPTKVDAPAPPSVPAVARAVTFPEEHHLPSLRI
jgi:hypothetical protein